MIVVRMLSGTGFPSSSVSPAASVTAGLPAGNAQGFQVEVEEFVGGMVRRHERVLGAVCVRIRAEFLWMSLTGLAAAECWANSIGAPPRSRCLPCRRAMGWVFVQTEGLPERYPRPARGASINAYGPVTSHELASEQELFGWEAGNATF